MTFPRWESLRFGGRVGRLPYLAAGVVLAAAKLGLDSAVATVLFGRAWSPTRYALTGEVGGLFALDRADQVFYATMLGVALPFVAVGLVLTARRLRDAGWPLWAACLFFAPLPINLAFFVVLGLTPGRPPRGEVPIAWVDDQVGRPPEIGKGKGVAAAPGLGKFGRAVGAILIPMPVAGLVAYGLTHVLGDYGWSLFLGLPFVMPMASVILYGAGRSPSYGESMLVGVGWMAAALALIVMTAFEGMICIVMLLPLAVPIVLLGASLGHAVLQLGPGRPRDLRRAIGALLATLPLMGGAEHLTKPKAPLFECVTSVEVDVPPGLVWRRVVAFPDLAPPGDFLSKAGVAYPVRARIEGSGVGAIRRCEFSTGAFVEPIEVWDEPRLLRFSVTSGPSPMREWNPFFEIHPPHLDGFLVSRRGQFLLEPLPGGRTRMVGTTWYQHGLWPASYWRLWSEPILHAIHRRVLDHVKALAEGDARRR